MPRTAVAINPPRGTSPVAAGVDIIVVSDRTLFRDCVVEFLRRHGFGQAKSCARKTLLNRPRPIPGNGLLLIDVGQGQEDPEDMLDEMRKHAPEATVVAIGTPMQLAAQAADADGWIRTSDAGWRLSAVAAAVVKPHTGKVHFAPDRETLRQMRTWRSLTPRQRQVLALLGCGVDNHRLGRALGVTERAVKMHVSALFDRFKADNRVELALIACHAGLHRPTGPDPFQSRASL